MNAFSPTAPLTRAACFITGTDPDLLATCPKRDIDMVHTLALLMVGLFVWQTATFTLAGHIMRGTADQFDPLYLLPGLWLAFIILLLDSIVIMRASWHAHGLESLKRGGAIVPQTIGARIKAGCMLALRVALSFVIAALMAIVFSIFLFHKEIDRARLLEFQDANAGLYAEHVLRYDEQITTNRRDQRTLREQLQRGAEEAVSLRQTLVSPAVDAPELKLAVSAVERLEEAKAIADRDLAAAQAFATNELAGIRAAPGNSGVAGVGPVRRAAEERLAAATERATAVQAELETAHARLREFEPKLTAAITAKRAYAETNLRRVQEAAAEAQARLEVLGIAETALLADRESALRSAVESDPQHVPMDDGLLGRVRLLGTLADNLGVLAAILLVKVFLLGIDLVAVFAKTTAYIPSTYALRLVTLDYRDAYHAVRTVEAFSEEEFDRSPPTGLEAPTWENTSESPPAAAEPFGAPSDVIDVEPEEPPSDDPNPLDRLREAAAKPGPTPKPKRKAKPDDGHNDSKPTVTPEPPPYGTAEPPPRRRGRRRAPARPNRRSMVPPAYPSQPTTSPLTATNARKARMRYSNCRGSDRLSRAIAISR